LTVCNWWIKWREGKKGKRSPLIEAADELATPSFLFLYKVRGRRGDAEKRGKKVRGREKEKPNHPSAGQLPVDFSKIIHYFAKSRVRAVLRGAQMREGKKKEEEKAISISTGVRRVGWEFYGTVIPCPEARGV